MTAVIATATVAYADIAVTITADTLKTVGVAAAVVTATAAARRTVKYARITSIAHSISIPLVYLRKTSYYTICAFSPRL